MSAFKARFWGTRGSIPAPGPQTSRYGGNTSCVELRVGSSIFILDAGTGIRGLGDALMAEHRGRPIHGRIFISHTHWDHIQGFPFFVPAYVPGNSFVIHGAHGAGKSFEEVFRGLMDPAYFPVDLGDMASDIKFREPAVEPFDCDGVMVETIYTHHPGLTVGYRFKSAGHMVCYVTDHEPYHSMSGDTEYARKQDKMITDFCEGADLLICDSQYTDEEYKTKKGWGHARYRDTIRMAITARCRRVALFHHDPSHNDEQMDKIAADAADFVKLSEGKVEAFCAREGQTVEI